MRRKRVVKRRRESWRRTLEIEMRNNAKWWSEMHCQVYEGNMDAGRRVTSSKSHGKHRLWFELLPEDYVIVAPTTPDDWLIKAFDVTLSTQALLWAILDPQARQPTSVVMFKNCLVTLMNHNCVSCHLAENFVRFLVASIRWHLFEFVLCPKS